MLKLRRPSPALVVATAACVIATSGVAFSAPSGPDGTIHACYDAAAYAQGGSLIEVVPSAESCSRPGSDFPDHFTFNATGPAGPAGATGASGAQGVPGAPGAKGTDAVKATLPAKDVKALEKELKETLASEKKVKEELKDYKQADTPKQKQEQVEALIRQMVEMLKQLQDQQAQQMQAIIRKG